ncbi:hypothetical protein P4305_18875 [Bacillus thuringiensis]|nr:hypothetical protein [Bacillus thuringiensis]
MYSIIVVGFVYRANGIRKKRLLYRFICFILIEFKALSLPLATAIVGGFFFACIHNIPISPHCQ